jgi:glucose-1-phosphate adenylyltransferase
MGVFTIILGGGRGRMLSALTAHRCKPALPFGGKYRIIDFALSNSVQMVARVCNDGLLKH